MKDLARAFAIERHGGQLYGDQPYSVHLDAVARLAAPYGEQAEVIACLHDVVEDTDTPLSEIEARFGPFVAACVGILTDEAGAGRPTRKARTYTKMAAVSGPESLALVVKAADRLANVEACVAGQQQTLLEKYCREQAAFYQAAYRPGLCDSLWESLAGHFAQKR
ncbi:MAG: bifunctional (p)ppGpp synthetase/guanosine-3',5'-bis(diphosphate) 3'-pyrophosphohydrolase [Candidatus Sericytochromatia bacterium]|nr:bifunctional (p)ppGpp synthetase/guanosine-3',5'-bis(diphosphate) 3'-pyrophosphohydrolase [Candidatus Sericytochromatia bacterium]